MRREWGQAQCGWDTASTCQCYLFAASLPPHSVTEQASLKKVSIAAPLVSGQKSDTEETCKQKKLNRGNHLGSGSTLPTTPEKVQDISLLFLRSFFFVVVVDVVVWLFFLLFFLTF